MRTLPIRHHRQTATQDIRKFIENVRKLISQNSKRTRIRSNKTERAEHKQPATHLLLLLLLSEHFLMRTCHMGVDLLHGVVRVHPPRIVGAPAVALWLVVHAAVHVHAVGGNGLHVLLVEREALVVRGVLVVACRKGHCRFVLLSLSTEVSICTPLEDRQMRLV